MPHFALVLGVGLEESPLAIDGEPGLRARMGVVATIDSFVEQLLRHLQGDVLGAQRVPIGEPAGWAIAPRAAFVVAVLRYVGIGGVREVSMLPAASTHARFAMVLARIALLDQCSSMAWVNSARTSLARASSWSPSSARM